MRSATGVRPLTPLSQHHTFVYQFHDILKGGYQVCPLLFLFGGRHGYALSISSCHRKKARMVCNHVVCNHVICCTTEYQLLRCLCLLSKASTGTFRTIAPFPRPLFSFAQAPSFNSPVPPLIEGNAPNAHACEVPRVNRSLVALSKRDAHGGHLRDVEQKKNPLPVSVIQESVPRLS